MLEIGKGAYSVVYKVKRKSDDQVYALKKVSVRFEIENKFLKVSMDPLSVKER